MVCRSIAASFMARGRPPNPPRNEARAAGLKVYVDPTPCFCGSIRRYTSNAQCVDCSIAKGRARYASLDEQALAKQKARDHARYLRSLSFE